MTTLDPPATEARALDREHRAITVGLLALVTMFAFEAVAVGLAMPSVAASLDGETLYPIAVIGMLTAAVVGMVVGGIWSDARSADLPLLAGGLVFTVGLLVSGWAGSMELFAMAWVLPSVVGPFVAGALVDLVGWRAVFLVVAAFALVSTAAVRVAMAGRLTTRRERFVWGRRPAYSVVAASGAVALHLAGHRTGLVGALMLLAGLLVVVPAARALLPPARCAPTAASRRSSPRGIFGGASRASRCSCRWCCRARAGSARPSWDC